MYIFLACKLSTLALYESSQCRVSVSSFPVFLLSYVNDTVSLDFQTPESAYSQPPGLLCSWLERLNDRIFFDILTDHPWTNLFQICTCSYRGFQRRPKETCLKPVAIIWGIWNSCFDVNAMSFGKHYVWSQYNYFWNHRKLHFESKAWPKALTTRRKSNFWSVFL